MVSHRCKQSSAKQEHQQQLLQAQNNGTFPIIKCATNGTKRRISNSSSNSKNNRKKRRRSSTTTTTSPLLTTTTTTAVVVSTLATRQILPQNAPCRQRYNAAFQALQNAYRQTKQGKDGIKIESAEEPNGEGNGNNINNNNNGIDENKLLELKRNMANCRERQRTEELNEAFKRLRRTIPSMPSDKMSKIHTLRIATEYIRFLDQLHQTLEFAAETAATTTAMFTATSATNSMDRNWNHALPSFPPPPSSSSASMLYQAICTATMGGNKEEEGEEANHQAMINNAAANVEEDLQHCCCTTTTTMMMMADQHPLLLAAANNTNNNNDGGCSSQTTTTTIGGDEFAAAPAFFYDYSMMKSDSDELRAKFNAWRSELAALNMTTPRTTISPHFSLPQ